MASARTELERYLLDIPGLVRGRSRYGHGPSYFVGGLEVAHFHGDERMDVRLTRELIRERKSEGEFDGRVRTRGPSADWVEVQVAGVQDIPLAVSLVEAAVHANS